MTEGLHRVYVLTSDSMVWILQATLPIIGLHVVVPCESGHVVKQKY